MYSSRQELPGWYTGCIWILTILLCFVGPIAGAFMKPEKAESVMVNAGYTNVQVGDRYEWFVFWRGCGYDDVAEFRITSATNPNGVVVTNAVVCKGVFNGHMIRYLP